MKIYDISAEISSAPVFPGDAETKIEKTSDIDIGDSCTVSSLTMSLHTGTHVEAPAHFLREGKTVDEENLGLFFGPCEVVSCGGYSGVLTGADLDELIPEGTRRVLFKTLGAVRLSKSAVLSLLSSGVTLIGIDAPSVSYEEDDTEIHTLLMHGGVVILEGLVLSHVQSGGYTLMAMPLKINGVEASPCRALLFT